MDFTITSRLPASDGSDQQSFSISNLFLIFLSLTPPFLSSLLTDDLNSYPQRKLKPASGKSFFFAFFFFCQGYKSPLYPSQPSLLLLTGVLSLPIQGLSPSFCVWIPSQSLLQKSFSYFIILFSLNRSFSLNFKLAEASLLLKQQRVKNPSPFAPCLFPSTVLYHSFP